MRDRINSEIKVREAFIPVAPSCLAEHGSEYFMDYTPTPFMSFAYHVQPEKAKLIPAALHADGSARVQGVDTSCYKLFRRLIQHFYKITGIPMVLNTSLNQHGEPIAHRPTDAIELFTESSMDELILGSFIVRKAGT